MEKIPEEILTINELAERLKIKPSWIYAKTMERGEGTIPKIKVGKYIRFDESEVLQWLKEKQQNES